MKYVLQLLFSFWLGIGIGWYFGFSRPVVSQQRKLLEEYAWLRNSVDFTDLEFSKIVDELPTDWEEMFSQQVENDSKLMALVGLDVFKNLDRGDTDAVKSRMAMYVGGYYRIYHEKGGDQDLLLTIEETARDYPAIAAEISNKD